MHQDITPKIRNRVINIHVNNRKIVSDKEVWFIYNAMIDYGFHRIVTYNQEIIREKGTDRSLFLKGMVDKYSWVDLGSSYLPNELSSAYLYAQLEKAVAINEDRLLSWKMYFDELKPLSEKNLIELPHIPVDAKHNGHMFYLKVEDIHQRSKLIEYLRQYGIIAVFHYIPLHSSIAGQKFGKFAGDDIYTTPDSERLLRLPMYSNISKSDIKYITKNIKAFFGQ